jgi:hypothetical protein
VGFPGTGDFRGAMPSDEDERCIMLHGIIPLLVTLLSPDSLGKGATGAYGAIMYMIVIIVDLMRWQWQWRVRTQIRMSTECLRGRADSLLVAREACGLETAPQVERTGLPGV